MVDHVKYENDLRALLKDDNYIDYLQLLNMIFSNIHEKEDVNNFVTILLNLENQYQVYTKKELTNEYTSFLLTIRECVIRFLNTGHIPTSNYLYLFVLFRNIEIPQHETINQHIIFFNNDILNLDWNTNDILIENDIIFLLNILNNNTENGFIEYIQRLITTYINMGFTTKYVEFVNNFIQFNNISIDYIHKAIAYNIDLKIFFKFNFHQQRSIFAWAYEFLHQSTSFGYDKKSQTLYPKLIELLHHQIKQNNIEEVLYLQFFIFITNASTFQLPSQWEMLTNDVTMPVGNLYKQYAKENKLPSVKQTKNKKIKIGFIFERIIKHSPFNVMFTLFKALYDNDDFQNNYSITIYSLNYYSKMPNHKELIHKLQNLGINVVFPVASYIIDEDYSSRLERALTTRQTIQDDNIDIMIAATNNYDVLDFLFATRTVSKQYFWSHGNFEYNITGIDKKISHFTPDKNKYKNYETFDMPLNIDKYNPLVKEEDIIIEKQKYPQNVFILGTIGRLIKIDDISYLTTVAEILQENPNTIYLACGSGNQESIKDKLKKLNILERFYFPGHIDSHIYGHIVNLWLEPFPHNSGESLTEFVFKKNLFVKLYTKDDIDKNEADYNNFLKYIWVDNIPDYISHTTKLINDKTLRDSIKKPLLQKYINFHTNDTKNSFIKLLSK